MAQLNKISNINSMRTDVILWHLLKRHAVFLLILTNILTLVLWVVSLPPTIK